jgi:hypothetical protein
VPEQPRLDVLEPQRLAQQRVVAQVDLADGEVVGGAPPGVQQNELLAFQGCDTSILSGGSPSPDRAVSWAMARHLARNEMVTLTIAAILLTIFEVSGHHVPTLPADASPIPVLGGSVLLGALATIAEERLRRLLR